MSKRSGVKILFGPHGPMTVNLSKMISGRRSGKKGDAFQISSGQTGLAFV